MCLPCEIAGSLGCVRALGGLVPSSNHKLPIFLLNFTDPWARHGAAVGLSAGSGQKECTDCLKMPVGNTQDKPTTENLLPGAGLAFQNH